MSWQSSSLESQRLRTPQETSADSSDGRMVLDFSEAMHTFRSMFPNLDDDVIEQVLRSHGGAVDSTIDSLLRISSPVSEETRSSLHNGATSFRSKALSSDNTVEDVSESLDKFRFITSARSRWQPAMLRPLPPDFLVINSAYSSVSQDSTASSVNMLRDLNCDTLSKRLRENEELRVNAATAGMEDGDLQAFLEDERIAIMLQNEEFVKMLSQDEDFMESMNREQGLSSFPAASARYTPSSSSLPLDHPYYHESRQDELQRLPDRGVFPYTATASRASVDNSQRHIGPDMTKHMGHSTKVKLAKLAKKFFSRKSLSVKRPGHGLPHLSPDSKANQGTLSSAGQAPLLDDDELANASNGAHGSLISESGHGGAYGRI